MASAMQPTLDLAAVTARTSELVARQVWSRDRLMAHQTAQLREMLRRTVKASPYYREVIGELVARNAPLREFPAMTKTTLMANFDRIVTDTRVSRALVEQHLSGDGVGALLLGEYRAVATGGTTGERGIFIYDAAGWEFAVANLLRFQRLVGVLPTTRSVGVGAPSPIHLTNRFFAELRSGRPGAPRLSVTMPLPEVVQGLNAYQPEVLSTYASFLRRLAEEQRAGRLRIAPRRIRSVAETLTQDVRDLVRTVWGVQVINGYAATEIGVIGQECEHAAGVHVAEDLLVFEVVDASNNPAPPGIRGAKALVTPLTNSVLPLIRYELSDVVVMAEGACSCGSPLARIAEIVGRREELLSIPTATGGSVDVSAGRLGSSLMRIAAIRQYQFAQIPGGIRVLIAPTTERDAAELREDAKQAVRAVLASHDAATAVVEVEIVNGIERVGGGAKEKLVIGPRPAAK